MAKQIKHYEIRIAYIESEVVRSITLASCNKPDYLSKQEPREDLDTISFITIENETIIIMKSIVGMFRYKPVYETES